MENTYRIANRNITIRSIHSGVHKLFKDYLTDGTADFSVEIKQSDIDTELQKCREQEAREGIFRTGRNDPYLEELSVCRKMAEKMLEYDTILFHGSTVAVDGEAYIFTALSGTGKSTHAALWREYLGEKAVMVNDDKPFIEIREGKAIAYGTPYDGKHHLSTNISAPVKAICILERADVNSIEKISPEEAFPTLFQQTYNTQDNAGIGKTLLLLNSLLGCCNFYRLHCNMDIEAAMLAYETMKG